MSLPVAIPFRPKNTEETIAKLQNGISECASMCSALGDFLAAAFPSASKEARNFEQWLEVFLNHNTKEYLEDLRKPAPPMPAGFQSFDPFEHLAGLCRKRDGMQSQIDAFNMMLDKLGDKNEEMAEMMRGQLNVSGLPQALEELNEQISNFQRQMEAQPVPANEPAGSQSASPEAKQ